MREKVVCKSMQIHTTSACTLKCKKCGWRFAQYQKPMIANIDITCAALEKLFKIYDYIEEFRFAGAEAFLYPDLERLMHEAEKYKNQFDYAIIVTNGTYLPSQQIVNTMKELSYPIIVRVDHYGELSSKYSEVVTYLKDNNLNVDERIYYGEDQAFGGWVDLGEFEYCNYTEEELNKIFNRCRLPKDSGLLIDDLLCICNHVMVADWLGKVEPAPRDMFHILSGLSVEEMREMVVNWRDKPFETCKYCYGFDPENGRRIPAAEQL